MKPSYHKRIGCQATGRVCHPESSGVENAPGVEGEGSDASPRRWLGPAPRPCVSDADARLREGCSLDFSFLVGLGCLSNGLLYYLEWIERLQEPLGHLKRKGGV